MKKGTILVMVIILLFSTKAIAKVESMGVSWSLMNITQYGDNTGFSLNTVIVNETDSFYEGLEVDSKIFFGYKDEIDYLNLSGKLIFYKQFGTNAYFRPFIGFGFNYGWEKLSYLNAYSYGIPLSAKLELNLASLIKVSGSVYYLPYIQAICDDINFNFMGKGFDLCAKVRVIEGLNFQVGYLQDSYDLNWFNWGNKGIYFGGELSF